LKFYYHKKGTGKGNRYCRSFHVLTVSDIITKFQYYLLPMKHRLWQGHQTQHS